MSGRADSETDKQVNLLARERVFDGYFKIERYRLRHTLHAGGESPELVREVLERGHVAAALLVDPDHDTVVLIEQFRQGAFAAGWEPWMYECVAGIIEPGEDALEVARRESLEESGCEVADLQPMMRFITTPGASSETVMLYCARVDTSEAGGIHGLAHEGEDIKVHVFAIEDAYRMVDDGKIVNAITIIALQWLRLNYAGLKQRWLNGPTA